MTDEDEATNDERGTTAKMGVVTVSAIHPDAHAKLVKLAVGQEVIDNAVGDYGAMIVAGCHPRGTLRVGYDHGLLFVDCATCHAPVTIVKVAP